MSIGNLLGIFIDGYILLMLITIAIRLRRAHRWRFLLLWSNIQILMQVYLSWRGSFHISTHFLGWDVQSKLPITCCGLCTTLDFIRAITTLFILDYKITIIFWGIIGQLKTCVASSHHLLNRPRHPVDHYTPETDVLPHTYHRQCKS